MSGARYSINMVVFLALEVLGATCSATEAPDNPGHCLLQVPSKPQLLQATGEGLKGTELSEGELEEEEGDPCDPEDPPKDDPQNLRPWEDIVHTKAGLIFLNSTGGDMVETWSWGMKKIDFHQHAQRDEKSLRQMLRQNKHFGIEKSVLLALRKKTDGEKEVRDTNDWVMKVHKDHPHFLPFVTIHPNETWSPHMFREYIKKGARGLKLIDWHSQYILQFNYTLDNPTMMAIYKIAEEEQVPILMHVWLGFRGYRYSDVLDKILSKFPRLNLVLAHMGLGFHPKEFPKLRGLLQKHKHLYVDTSFYGAYKEVWFQRASEQKKALASLVHQFPTQVLFGSDTFSSPQKKKRYYQDAVRCQLLYIEFDKVRCSEFQKTKFYKNGEHDKYGSLDWTHGQLHGLGVKQQDHPKESRHLLQQILYDNAHKLLSLKYQSRGEGEGEGEGEGQ